jgi:hypothetical protein
MYVTTTHLVGFRNASGINVGDVYDLVDPAGQDNVSSMLGWIRANPSNTVLNIAVDDNGVNVTSTATTASNYPSGTSSILD